MECGCKKWEALVHTVNPDSNFWSPSRKFDTLDLWRKTGGKVLAYGVTSHEIEQWDGLEKSHLRRGLVWAGPRALTLAEMRAAPKANLTVKIIHKDGALSKIVDSKGFPVLEPKLRLSWLALYCIVKSATEQYGICTPCDVVHHLWASEAEIPQKVEAIDALVSTVAKNIPKRIEKLKGRGYRLVDLTAPTT